jgi:Zn-dependent M28 family amino/carboxypeptidase
LEGNEAHKSTLTRRQALTGAAVLGSAATVGRGATAAAAREVSGAPVSGLIREMLEEIDPRNIERTILGLVSFGTRNTLSSQTDPKRGIGAARDWLLQQFQQAAAASNGRMTVGLQSYLQPVGSRIPTPTVITNVVATLQGAKPDSKDRIYVVSGHYDSRGTDVLDTTLDAPGANDDASGVAAALEMARVMSTRQFDATLVFMAVAGEEQGLYGSNFYATQAKAQGLNVAGMITNDIIGSSTAQDGKRDPFRVRLFVEGLPSTPVSAEAALRLDGGETELPPRQLARYIKEVGENEGTSMSVDIIYRRDRFGRGGDHIPFLAQGYPAVRFTEWREDYRHQHQDTRLVAGVQWGDLPQFVDYNYIARVTRVNATALASLALAPATPSGALIDPTAQVIDTALKWNANTESDLAGYEVLYRPTTDPFWTSSVVIPVGNVTSFTVKDVYKDDYFFGVRAIDSSGNRSPVAAFIIPGT